jgi:hypothetical protein
MFRLTKLCHDSDSLKPWSEAQRIFAPLLNRQIETNVNSGKKQLYFDCYATSAMPELYKQTDLQFVMHPISEEARLRNQILRERPRHPEMSEEQLTQMCSSAGQMTRKILQWGLYENNFRPIELINDYTQQSLENNANIIKSCNEILQPQLSAVN